MKLGFGLFAGGIAAGFLAGGGLHALATYRHIPTIVTQRVYDSPSWILRSEHLVFGMPRPVDSRYDISTSGSSPKKPGISVLVREGFVIGHADRFKAPIWVSVHWNRKYFDESESLRDSKRDFEEDPELPDYARGSTRYENSAYQRGHMARNKDNLAFGSDNTSMGDRMSNIVPQRPSLNERVWGRLEDDHRKVVAAGKIDEIWIISGAVYDGMKPIETVGNGIGVPVATYKVIGWYDDKRRFNAQGFVIPQTATEVGSTRYLVSIRSIEERTGLDFFPELSPQESERIEATTPRVLWESP